MSGIPIGVAALDGVVLTVLTHLSNGEVDDAVTRFAEEFRFKDYGIGFFDALSRKVPVSLGASIVRTDKGMITDRSDYYDGLVSRRTALASYFREWVEL